MNTPNVEKRLAEGAVQIPPLEITVVRLGSPKEGDTVVDVRWRDRTGRYFVECKNDSRPLTLRRAIDQAKRYAEVLGDGRPMVAVPYLSDKKLNELAVQGVSGIDLCGNCLVEGSDFSFLRTGNRNRYPDSDRVRSAYRGSASLVARAMLLRERFEAVGDVLDFIEANGGRLVLSTVSKALKPLEEDLAIDRESDLAVQVTDRAKILDQLADNYRAPKTQEAWTGRIDCSEEVLRRKLATLAGSRQIVQTGMSSASRYVSFAGEPLVAMYTPDPIDEVLAALGADANETRSFPNLTLIQTDDPTVYFDARPGGVASPIQTWLEMANGDKRSREASQPLREALQQGEGVNLGR